jgi:LAS superfamily LD-carboxypeptidase LdcB
VGSRVPGPVGVSATSGVASGASTVLGVSGEGRTLAEFKQAVLQGQIRRKQRQGKTHFDPVPADELEDLEPKLGSKHKHMLRMRKGAARACRDLLKAARDALQAAQAASDPLAQRTTAIGACSAYRDYTEDSRAWSNTFDKHYDMPETRALLSQAPGGVHGDAAVKLFVELMSPIKAPPGFSNHSNGKAVDFATVVSGVTLAANTSQHAQWRSSWLHPWLVANAPRFGFKALKTEEWHWDFT